MGAFSGSGFSGRVCLCGRLCGRLATPAQRQQPSHARTGGGRGLVQQNQLGLCVVRGTPSIWPLLPRLPPALIGSYQSCLVHPSVIISKPQREIHNSRILKGKKGSPACWLWQFWQLGKGMCPQSCPPRGDLLKTHPSTACPCFLRHLCSEGQISLFVNTFSSHSGFLNFF